MTVLCALLSAGCASQSAIDFHDESPALRPESFFVGTLVADGVFFDRWNNVRRRFHLDLVGEIVDGQLHLREDLTYDNGDALQRTYIFTKIDDHIYEANADGLVGPARIEAYGNVLNWKYRLRQKIGDSEWVLKFDDWMYRVSEDSILNRAYASKFGFRVGEVFMLVRKVK